MKIEVEPLRTWLARPEYQPEYLVMKKGLDAKVAFLSKTIGKTTAITQILNDRCREFRTSTDYGRIWDDLSTNPEMAASEILKYPGDEYQQHLFCSQCVAISYLRKMLEPRESPEMQANAHELVPGKVEEKRPIGRLQSIFLRDASMEELFVKKLTRLINLRYLKENKKFCYDDSGAHMSLSTYISCLYAACFEYRITASEATPKSFYRLLAMAWDKSEWGASTCPGYTDLTRKLNDWQKLCRNPMLKGQKQILIFDIGSQNLAPGKAEKYQICRDSYDHVKENAEDINLFCC